MEQNDTKLYYDLFHNMVFRVAFLFFKNEADAYDCVQDVFIKLIKQKKTFKDREHVKAWLLCVTSNHCKSQLRCFWRKNRVDEEYIKEIASTNPMESELLYTLLRLPEKYKDVLYMHYFEGYKLDDIACILHMNPSTVRSRISRARELLKKEMLKEDISCLQKMNEKF